MSMAITYITSVVLILAFGSFLEIEEHHSNSETDSIHLRHYSMECCVLFGGVKSH